MWTDVGTCWRQQQFFIYHVLGKKEREEVAQRRRPSVKPAARWASFLHPSRLQRPLLIFYLSAIW